jgi:hypothetical protein
LYAIYKSFFEFKHHLFINFIDDADNISGDGLDEGDDPEGKAEYVKKVFVAQPWTDLGSMADVN